MRHSRRTNSQLTARRARWGERGDRKAPTHSDQDREPDGDCKCTVVLINIVFHLGKDDVHCSVTIILITR